MPDPDMFQHERFYRGAEALTQLKYMRLTVCGVGAVGSNLVDNLVRQGFEQITLIDFDRVESHNIGSQTYTKSDVGMFKVEALQSEMFRVVGVELETIRQKLTERNVAKLLKKANLVIDAFDNHLARALVTEYCRTASIPCLHVGLNADYAEIMWNENYRVPQDVTEAGLDAPACGN